MADYTKYGSNSDRSKSEQTEMRDGAALRPVPTDDYVPKKTNWFREFVRGDVDSARQNVVRDVIFPFTKRMIIDSVTVFLTTILDNVANPGKKRTDYNSISRGGTVTSPRYSSAPEPVVSEGPSAFHMCTKETRGEATIALDVMHDLLNRTGKLYVREYYEIMGYKDSVNASFDNHFGWTDISRAVVGHDVWNGYYFIQNMGRPSYID